MGSRGALERIVGAVREHLPAQGEEAEHPVLESKEGYSAIYEASKAITEFKALDREPPSTQVDVQLRVDALRSLAKAMRVWISPGSPASLFTNSWQNWCIMVCQAVVRVAAMAPMGQIGTIDWPNTSNISTLFCKAPHFGTCGFIPTITLCGFSGPSGVPERTPGRLGAELLAAGIECYGNIQKQIQLAPPPLGGGLDMAAWKAISNYVYQATAMEIFLCNGATKKAAGGQAAANRRAQTMITALCDSARMGLAASRRDLGGPEADQAQKNLVRTAIIPLALHMCDHGTPGLHALLAALNDFLATEFAPQALKRVARAPLLPDVLDLLAESSLLAVDRKCNPPADAVAANRAAWNRIAGALQLPEKPKKHIEALLTPPQHKEQAAIGLVAIGESSPPPGVMSGSGSVGRAQTLEDSFSSAFAKALRLAQGHKD